MQVSVSARALELGKSLARLKAKMSILGRVRNLLTRDRPEILQACPMFFMDHELSMSADVCTISGLYLSAGLIET